MAGGLNAPRLVVDVGGTNVRFALADAKGALDRVHSHPVAAFKTFAEALSAYRETLGRDGGAFGSCAIAAAGPVDGDQVKLTNNPWTIDRREVAAAIGVPVLLINDLEAVAAALPHLSGGDLKPIGVPAPMRPERRTMLAVNVGTGFGAATVIWRGKVWWTCPSEAGHMALGRTAADVARALGEDATVETLLSGRGVVELYERLAGMSCHSADIEIDAAALFERVDADPIAARVTEAAIDGLARVAGDLALATAAWGGVYFCGSVAAALTRRADPSRFREAFAHPGTMQPRMQQVATAFIARDNASLFGLAMIAIQD